MNAHQRRIRRRAQARAWSALGYHRHDCRCRECLVDRYGDHDDGHEYDDCWACGGDGTYHDCGEDCCVCLYPDFDEQVACEECGGSGRVRVRP